MRFFIFCLLALFPALCFAHPLDISQSTLTLQENSIKGTTLLHSFEGQYLASRIAGKPVYDFQSVFQFENNFFEYLQSHIKIINNQKPCRFQKESMPKKEDPFILTDGFSFEYSFVCDEALKNLFVENTLFVDDFELQTNKMFFYGLKDTNFELRKNKVLNKEITSFAWNVQDQDSLTIQDADKDGVSDEDERSFKTNPNKADSDDDNYSDFEEIQASWNPNDSVPGPGQQLREKNIQEPIDRTPQIGWFEKILEKIFTWILSLLNP